MAPNHPPGANKGAAPQAEGSPPPRHDGAATSDRGLMEEVVRDLTEQNQHARAEDGAGTDHQRDPQKEAERARTVHVDSDSGFRAPVGAAAARAYMPAQTLEPAPAATIEPHTVKLEDPRRLPTLRLPRMRKEVVLEEGKGRTGRVAAPEDTLPPMRAPVGVTMRPQPAKLSGWVLGLIISAVVAVLVIALAVRFWPASSLPGAPSGTPSTQPHPPK